MSQLTEPSIRFHASNVKVVPIVAPLLVGVAFLGLWQMAVSVWKVDPYILPSPSAIGEQVSTARTQILDGMIGTGRNALIGLVIGAVAGVVGAVVSSLAKPLEWMAAPVVAAASVVPIVALAPVFYTMFGAAANTGRILIAAIAAGIPIYLNTLRGLGMVAPVHSELMRVYAATPLQRAGTVTLPTALPYVFTGLRIASSLAVISALIAEYFGGPVDGLGKAITTAASASNYPLAWAYVVGSIVLGLAFYVVALLIELWSTRHQPST
jgi:NitT/TauT family transport system permease protein